MAMVHVSLGRIVVMKNYWRFVIRYYIEYPYEQNKKYKTVILYLYWNFYMVFNFWFSHNVYKEGENDTDLQWLHVWSHLGIPFYLPVSIASLWLHISFYISMICLFLLLISQCRVALCQLYKFLMKQEFCGIVNHT